MVPSAAELKRKHAEELNRSVPARCLRAGANSADIATLKAIRET